MKIEIIKCLQDNYSYLIIDEKSKSACVVDPSEAEPIIDYVEKNNINLKFILNTHHHFDHVGGNKDLKKKYNSKVVGFSGDKERIPEIDIILKDKEIWKEEKFEAKIFHIPGHTSGHICFNFFNEKLLFTGDTLFSLGCGRIFEGTYEQMFNSLNLIKTFPKETKIFCGHEYTIKNSKFCLMYDKDNKKLKQKIIQNKKRIEEGFPTIPTTLEDELNMNIFLRSDRKDIQSNLNLINSNPFETFSKLRDLKDNF
jgi:hydroxyacylglutathione hydrolase